jgi:hypothetical protein
MNAVNLKSRAKRLRTSISRMFGIQVTLSQSLELVAKEENFPNWDAASAACKFPSAKTSAPTLSEPGPMMLVECTADLSIEHIMGGSAHDVAQLKAIRSLLDDESGGLILVGGLTAQGKTTTLTAIVNDVARRNTKGELVRVCNMSSELNHNFDPRIVVVPEQLCGGSPWPDLIFMDDIRTPRMAFEAVSMARAGAKVAATIHSAENIVERMQALLRSYIGKTVFDALIAEQRVMMINQRLVWSKPGDEEIAREKILRQRLAATGLKEFQVDSIVAQGKQAAYSLLFELEVGAKVWMRLNKCFCDVRAAGPGKVLHSKP